MIPLRARTPVFLRARTPAPSWARTLADRPPSRPATLPPAEPPAATGLAMKTFVLATVSGPGSTRRRSGRLRPAGQQAARRKVSVAAGPSRAVTRLGDAGSVSRRPLRRRMPCEPGFHGVRPPWLADRRSPATGRSARPSLRRSVACASTAEAGAVPSSDRTGPRRGPAAAGPAGLPVTKPESVKR